jgi:outer membrane murein-binding lipoprotein Lpp
VRSAAAHLFAPATAVRFQAGRSRPSLTAGQNPYSGVYVDYWLKQKPVGVTKLDFVDASGKVIRTFTSEDSSPAKADSARVAYTASDSLKALTAFDTTGQSSQRKQIESDSVSYEPADSLVQARAGLNRFVWNLRVSGVREIKNVINDEGVTDGPMVVPGRYTVRLTVGGRTLSQPFTVVDDPRVRATPAELAASYDLASRTVAKINDITDAVTRIESLQSQLAARSTQVKGQAYAARVDSAATSLKGRLEAIRSQLADVHSEADQITLHYPVRPYNQLLNVNRMAQSFERGPTDQASAIYSTLAGQVDTLIARERALEAGEISAFNAMLRELGAPAVAVEVPKPIA